MYGGHIVNDVDRLLARAYLEHLMRVGKGLWLVVLGYVSIF